jgi:hypothetical protein
VAIVGLSWLVSELGGGRDDSLARSGASGTPWRDHGAASLELSVQAATVKDRYGEPERGE